MRTYRPADLPRLIFKSIRNMKPSEVLAILRNEEIPGLIINLKDDETFRTPQDIDIYTIASENVNYNFGRVYVTKKNEDRVVLFFEPDRKGFIKIIRNGYRLQLGRTTSTMDSAGVYHPSGSRPRIFRSPPRQH